MEFHEIDMVGPLNTDNIRAKDGTLAATISNGTGDVIFQNNLEVSNDLNVDRDATIFRNLEVQGPLSTFIQSITVGADANIDNDLTVGRDASVVRDASVGRNASVTTDLTVGNRVQTVNLRVTGGSPGAGKVLVAADGAGNIQYGTSQSIPTNAIILFDSDTAITGYTLLTDVDDELVYITKGSVAGGQAGGQPKPGSTWTRPTHVHATKNHRLTIAQIPSHRHPPQSGFANFMSSSGSTHGEGGDSYGVASYTGFTGGGLPHNHGNTEGGKTADSFRPKGRNWTRQQRN